MKKLLALFLTLLLSAAAQKAAAVAEPALLPFQDVKQGDWFYDAVSYAYGEKLLQGVSASSFNPSGQMDRAMFVTVLANLAGADTSSFTQQHFTDTAPGQWYTKNVEWAASFGIVSGMGNFQFAPRSPAGFTDYNKISSYAKTAMDWAISKKLIRGLSETVLDPQGTATRAQAAQIFCNAQSVLLKKQVAAPPVALPLPTEIDKKLYTMTLEEKVGQLFLPRFPGKGLFPSRLRPVCQRLFRQNKSPGAKHARRVPVRSRNAPVPGGGRGRRHSGAGKLQQEFGKRPLCLSAEGIPAGRRGRHQAGH